jgi:hypothetical protein
VKDDAPRAGGGERGEGGGLDLEHPVGHRSRLAGHLPGREVEGLRHQHRLAHEEKVARRILGLSRRADDFLGRRAVDRRQEDRALPGLSRAGQEEEASPVRQEARVAVRVVRVRELVKAPAVRGRDAVQGRPEDGGAR